MTVLYLGRVKGSSMNLQSQCATKLIQGPDKGRRQDYHDDKDDSFGSNSTCSIPQSMSNNWTKTTTHARARTARTRRRRRRRRKRTRWRGHPGSPAKKRQQPELTAAGARKGECQRLKMRRTQDGSGPHLRPEHGDRGVRSAEATGKP